MKTYNKSQIMKLAWVEAKRNSFYWVLPKKVKRASNNNPRVYTEQKQESLHNYYSRGSNTYYGD